MEGSPYRAALRLFAAEISSPHTAFLSSKEQLNVHGNGARIEY